MKHKKNESGKKDLDQRKPKYKHKAFFWSLNNNSKVKSNSESQNRHNAEVYVEKN